MHTSMTSSPPRLDTIAELRELYRAAEARAARMRLLSQVGKSLSEADAESLAEVLERCGERLAFFVGARSARVTIGHGDGGIAIHSPGTAEPVASIAIEGLASPQGIADDEDRETFRLYLELMGAAIDRANREAERGELLAALRERERRLEQLVGQIFSAQEEERRRVSQELHDGVAQTATALARMIEGPGGEASSDLPASERARLAHIVRDLVKELRSVIGGLRPTLLDDLGLEAAINALADAMREEGFEVSFASSVSLQRLPPIIETALFRVAQEAISNVRKHAGGPCAVFIELELGEGEARFLRIRDTGAGIRGGLPSATSPGQRIGVDVMTERMAAIGGQLEWTAGPKGGVTVTAFLPERQ